MLIERLAAAGLTVKEAEVLLDEALLIQSTGDDLAAVSWSTANRLLVADPESVIGRGWLAVHESVVCLGSQSPGPTSSPGHSD